MAELCVHIIRVYFRGCHGVPGGAFALYMRLLVFAPPPYKFGTRFLPPLKQNAETNTYYIIIQWMYGWFTCIQQQK